MDDWPNNITIHLNADIRIPNRIRKPGNGHTNCNRSSASISNCHCNNPNHTVNMEQDYDYLNNLIFVDVEGNGPAPTLNDLVKFEFGAVHYKTSNSFHGKSAVKETFQEFQEWLLKQVGTRRPVFISDNPAYDWQFINYYFHVFLGKNPIGHSASRISDFYAGLVGNFWNTQKWKRLRITPHNHHPVNDALGNVEAFKRLLNGER